MKTQFILLGHYFFEVIIFNRQCWQSLLYWVNNADTVYYVKLLMLTQFIQIIRLIEKSENNKSQFGLSPWMIELMI